MFLLGHPLLFLTPVILFVSTASLLYRKPVCGRIAIGFFCWQECKEDENRKNGSFEDRGFLIVEAAHQQLLKQQQETRVWDATLAAPPAVFFPPRDNSSRKREREIEGEVVTALRAGDNFLISSPPRSATSFFTRSLSSTPAKCPFGGTPGLPLMCPAIFFINNLDHKM